MKQTDQKKQRQSGFTLTEVLVTVTIIICLLAVSFIAISKYIRLAQITELDNAAREIYMAAQNQAILLKSSGELENLVIKPEGIGAGGTETEGTGGSTPVSATNQMLVDVTPNSDNTAQIPAYYISSKDTTIAKLLPKTGIEGKLWEGSFYIVYEPVSGSVIDVFYAKEADADAFTTESADFEKFYEKWRAAPKEDRMNNNPMIGYYGGASAESGTSLSLRTPVVNIYNEDVLRAEVTYWIPRSLSMINSGNAEAPGGVKLKVNLLYDDKEIPLELPMEPGEKNIGLEYTAIKYTWILDSLKEGEQFKDLFKNAKDINGKPVTAGELTMGEDFTITAAVSYEGKDSGLQVNGARKKATDNSLFAKGSGDKTAKIAYMRHLQNLDSDFSKVEGKNEAEQIADLTCDSSYNFIPVENGDLRSYNGSYNGNNFHIRELNVDASNQNNADITKDRKAYGLFGDVKGMEFSNIKLVNARVNGGTNPTGTLVGKGENLTISNCGVYWENTSATETNLRSVLGDSEKRIYYKVQGNVVGGLAGQMTGDQSQIIRSFAATTIEGTKTNGIAGGLVGSAEGPITIENSYGDNYLKGDNAAGLIGNLEGSAKVEDSYATGFIESDSNNDNAAGFCLGNHGVVESNRAYSTMLFSEKGKKYPLNPNDKDNSYINTYYLMSDFFKDNLGQAEDLGRDYATLTNPAQIETLYGIGNEFEMKNSKHTFPYNLQTTLNLTRYSYPGLNGMDHYGDWGAEFQNGSLVYYECYKKENEDGSNKTAYAFNGGNLSMITDEGDYAVEDGYALAFLSIDNTARFDVTYQVADGNSMNTKTLTYSMSSDAGNQIQQIEHDNETYYLLPLPKDIVNSTYAAENFYQEIKFSQGSGENKVTGDYYYNPHFANAVIEYDEELNLKEEAEKVQVQIRTARHLYMLSEHSEYYASNHQYNFVQDMNIDYSIYEGYDLFPMDEKNKIRIGLQKPIGLDESRPFKGNYHGKCHTIENVSIKSTVENESIESTVGNYIGLFGYSTGIIKDTTYLINEDTVGKISINTMLGEVYVGGLAGYNGGIIENCAVAGMEIAAKTYNFSTVYVGGLVGWNKGTIQKSSATLTELAMETNLSNGYAGGFVGLNTASSTIKQCYTVGRVDAERSDHKVNEENSDHRDVYVCGFAGNNGGAISQCYAAVNLEAGGDIKIYGFCSDKNNSGTYANNYYMNEGNFRYNGINYTAQYKDDHATPMKYGDFTKEDLSGKLFMSKPKEAKKYNQPDELYPYPGVVKDASGAYVHYGQWPELMDLNKGGIYYWEKMIRNEKTSYHMSAIILDPDKKTIDKVETLSTKHNDGGIITEYGYGYFTTKGSQSNGLSSEFVSYNNGTNNLDQSQPWPENTECNKAMAELMKDGTGDKYDFHSYNTWGTKENENGTEKKTGLYLTGTDNAWGSWTLILGENDKIEFYINPFFADSISLSEKHDDWQVDNSISTNAPGDSNAPFYVRSVDQLQFINWNGQEKNTGTVLTAINKDQFPFLGYHSGPIRNYYWKQSHDLQGGEDETYSPIAEFYDTTTGQGAQTETLYGWFGGTYDGDDYVIQDVNIQGHESSCTGLFGMVYDGTLKNIIMYSPTDSGKVYSADTNQQSESAWYAIGGLAGFAATDPESKDKDNAIENCAIAGYTIEDNHVGGGVWGGTCMGGLIGVSCMDLKGCTAVTKVVSKVTDNDNVRIGGLVGSCQKSISSCYAGGEINVNGAKTKLTHGIYVGGIVGGVYFKPLVNQNKKQIGDKGTISNKLENCYSYVTLPNASTKGPDGKTQYIKALYAVGGPGEITHGGTLDERGTTEYSNCYYLKDVVWSNNGRKAPTDQVRCDVELQYISKWHDKENKISEGYEPAWPTNHSEYGDPYPREPNEQVHDQTYEQMRGTLFDDLKNAGFKPVTTMTNDGKNPINGKYSFTSDPSLTGLNYPFPTILTQNDEDRTVNVHYGAWPIEGLSRENGSVPMEIDLFTDYNDNEKGAVKTEEISLSPLIATGGELTCTVKDSNGEEISVEKSPIEISLDGKTATLDKAFEDDKKVTLTVRGKKAGMAKIEIVYKDPTPNQDPENNKSYSLLIDVQVTAELQLLPEKSPAELFTLENALVPLNVADKNGKLLEMQGVEINTITDSVEKDDTYIEDADIIQNQGDAPGDKKIMLSMTTRNREGMTKATLYYEYTYLGADYRGSDPISVEITTPTIALDPLNIYLDDFDKKDVKYGSGNDVDEQIKLTVNNDTISNVSIIKVENGDNVGLVYAKLSTDGNITLEIRRPETTEASAVIHLKLRFTIDGVIHESRQDLLVNVYQGKEPTQEETYEQPEAEAEK